MSNLALWLLYAAVIAAGAAPVLLFARRRARRRNDDLVRSRIRELKALPAPDELPQARDLTKAEQRHLRGRAHPIARKRSGRPI
jgi:hypothetical protein